MRAINLYAGAVADAVIDGRAAVPEVPSGEDDFVELDDAGNPRRKSAGRRRPAGNAPARGKKGPARAEASADADAPADVAGDDAAE
jgi:small subunit ribosomal protein S2